MAAVRIKVQHCAITYGSPRCRRARSAASLHRPERTGTSGGSSWYTCDELKTQAASAAVSECANACASRGKACGVGTWEGGWDRLASAFRVRLPSVQSARLQRSSFAAPFAHQALDSSACAGEAALFLTSSSSTTSFRKSGFIVA